MLLYFYFYLSCQLWLVNPYDNYNNFEIIYFFFFNYKIIYKSHGAINQVDVNILWILQQCGSAPTEIQLFSTRVIVLIKCGAFLFVSMNEFWLKKKHKRKSAFIKQLSKRKNYYEVFYMDEWATWTNHIYTYICISIMFFFLRANNSGAHFKIRYIQYKLWPRVLLIYDILYIMSILLIRGDKYTKSCKKKKKKYKL